MGSESERGVNDRRGMEKWCGRKEKGNKTKRKPGGRRPPSPGRRRDLLGLAREMESFRFERESLVFLNMIQEFRELSKPWFKKFIGKNYFSHI